MSAHQELDMKKRNFSNVTQDAGLMTPPPQSGEMKLPPVMSAQEPASMEAGDSSQMMAAHRPSILEMPRTISSSLQTRNACPPPEVEHVSNALFVFSVLCVGACLYGVAEIQRLVEEFIVSVFFGFLHLLGLFQMYHLIMSIINFNPMALLSSMFVAMVEFLLPKMWMNHWVFPADDGFDQGNTTFSESMQNLGLTLVVFGIYHVLKYIYNHTDPSVYPTYEMKYAEPYDMRIGAFDEETREETEHWCLCSPTRGRSISDVELSNMEGGLVRRRLNFSGVSEASTSPTEGGIRKSNPAVPLLDDFAGAGYPDIIAKNRKKLENSLKSPKASKIRSASGNDDSKDGSASYFPEMPIPANPLAKASTFKIPRKSLPASRSLSSSLSQYVDTENTKDSGAAATKTRGNSLEDFGRQPKNMAQSKLELQALRDEVGMPHETSMQVEALSWDIEVLGMSLEEGQATRLRHEADLDARLKKHDHDEAIRKAQAKDSSIGEKITKGREDPDEAAIRRAFPNFASVVERRQYKAESD